ncbi:hypothetical protein J5N97_009883 [Dioscorea zingiberensis]|uniref:Uncharacterized protein n=1 Tax=Dioscorea zingiberensis TaxID=325984 RepID=A0A9D5CYD7_9LILI|nr:hypothetical protein J5N97_009883 [Dioscorea zingiberensis]
MALLCPSPLCASLTPSSLFSLWLHPTDASLLLLHPSSSLPSPPKPRLLLPFIASSHSRIYAFKGGERKREILESYGLDPSDFLPEPSYTQKARGRTREAEKAGKGRRAPQQPAETPKPPGTTHRLLQVLGGKARRRKLLSPKGMDVRPMMEVVRGAAFDILQVAGGCPASLRPGRWLDLYSGTGSVGIEAISRGCLEAHFVEMDPWVVCEVLRPNLECTGFVDNSVIHTMRVESFLKQAEESNGMDKSFDYVSVTPPYTAVDYAVLMTQLGNSPVIGENSFILVEYPLKTNLLESYGNLIKIADRRFGRTNLAVYGPTWAQKRKKSE